MAPSPGPDRIGLGWRPPLAASILANLDRIDIVEVIADDYLGQPDARVRTLRTLAAQVPVTLHGIGLGAASTAPVDQRRIDAMALLIDRVRPDSWSEHFAFVRGGGVEIGHLAAAPRNSATIDGAAANVARIRRTIGSAPAMENIATLIDPPASDRSELDWIRAVLAASDCPLLLDLHNVHANALNFGYDPIAFVRALPAARIQSIHISGGRMMSEGRLLDDHLHDPPDPVYELLEETAAIAPGPLTVILERDGKYPAIDVLLAQLDRMRAAVARGRVRRSA